MRFPRRWLVSILIVLGVLAVVQAHSDRPNVTLAAHTLVRHETGASSGSSQGALSGVYDVLMWPGDRRSHGLYHCMLGLNQDGVTNAITTASQCYPDVNLSDPHAEPRDSLPGEGPDGAPGLPPPPPYNWQAPSAGAGTYVPGSTSEPLKLVTCFRGLGGALGPNAIADVTIWIPEVELATYGALLGDVVVYPRQGSAQCAANVPAGQPLDPWAIDLYPTTDVNGAGPNYPAPWRTIGDSDFDNDGCSDAAELWSIATPTPMCGDDPYSALDLSGGSSDVSGSYTLVVAVRDADVCWNGSFGVPPTACSDPDGTLVPGVYDTCLLDVQQAGMALTARLYCYADSASIAVNPQVAGAKSCPPAGAEFCGDGLAGASPPGQTTGPDGQINFGDVDDKHAVLTGQLNTSTGRIALTGCMEDRDGMAAQGNVYLSVDVDAYTGQGTANVYANETTAHCVGGSPAGAVAPAPASLVRQATAAQQRDSDGDGCPDQRELSDSQGAGGLRDPFNHYDYMNASGDGQNRVDDILDVVGEYFHDDPPGAIDYTSTTDRTTMIGANEWNLGPPDGQQRVDDILAQVKQYFNDC